MADPHSVVASSPTPHDLNQPGRRDGDSRAQGTGHVAAAYLGISFSTMSRGHG